MKKIILFPFILMFLFFSTVLVAANNNPPPGNNGQPFQVLQGEIDAINGQVNSVNNQINSLSSQVSGMNSKITSLQSQINTLQTTVQQISLPFKGKQCPTGYHVIGFDDDGNLICDDKPVPPPAGSFDQFYAFTRGDAPTGWNGGSLTCNPSSTGICTEYTGVWALRVDQPDPTSYQLTVYLPTGAFDQPSADRGWAISTTYPKGCVLSYQSPTCDIRTDNGTIEQGNYPACPKDSKSATSSVVIRCFK